MEETLLDAPSRKPVKRGNNPTLHTVGFYTQLLSGKGFMSWSLEWIWQINHVI